MKHFNYWKNLYKQQIACFACLLLLLAANNAIAQTSRAFTDVSETAITAKGVRTITAKKYRTLQLDQTVMQQLFTTVTAKGSIAGRSSTAVFNMPMPDGRSTRFRIYETSVMEPELAAKFPELKTYAGQGIDDPSSTVWLDQNSKGFHAMVLSPKGSVFIDPYIKGSTEYYICYNKSDQIKNEPWKCETPGGQIAGDFKSSIPKELYAQKSNGTQLRNYRLALACTGEYAAFHGGTVALAFSAMVTTINRVNGVYETEVAIHMNLVANNNALVYTNSATDPYTDFNPDAMINENISNCSAVIGNANFDIGHVFSTGGGGLAGLGVVCTANKAMGVTGTTSPVGDGYDIDYVAHEIGHQFGGNHTFNSSLGACSGNVYTPTAYEPGSGITIQAYAGICDADNLAPNSIPYFHSISFDEIVNYSTLGGGNTCPVTIATGNTVPVVTTLGTRKSIPISTPFILTGAATDANGDAITYSWEEFDLGPSGAWNVQSTTAPMFRSFPPVASSSRTFPQLSDIINNTTSVGELLPNQARTLKFRLTVRDNRAGGGGVTHPDTTLNITVVNTGAPFSVTSPNTAITWAGTSTQNVTWNVSGTTANGINTANVNIRLSTDGGLTFPIVLAANTPNDGSQAITVPNIATTTARVKVEAADNIFFDMSNANFTITFSSFSSISITGISSSAFCPGATFNVNFTTNADANAGNVFTAQLSNAADSLATQVPIGTLASITGGTIACTIPLNSPAGNSYRIRIVSSTPSVISPYNNTNLTINPLPIISASANPSVICSGGNAQLTAYQYSSATGTPPTYCTANLSTYNACSFTSGSNLSNVTIAFTTLNNNSVCNFVSGVGPYTNYPASGNTTATLITGQTYTISVSNSDFPGIVSMWIDYNRNGTFEATEWVQVYTNANSGSASFTVPATATLGATKMRVRSRNSGNVNAAGSACSTFGSGTVEDYTITIANTAVNSYTWSPATFLNGTTGSSVAANGANATTTYTVTATTAAGCVSSATTTLTVNPLPTISAAASPDTICLGFSSSLTAVETAGPQTSLVYAAPGGSNNTFNDHITLVQFVNLNNPSVAGGSHYEDFTGTVPAALVYPGQSYSLTVNVANGGSQEYAAAWFDWNRNGIYETSEFVNVPLTLSGTYNGTVAVTVPSSAVAGVIHMRVRSQYGVGLSAGMANSSYTYGETEEYLVNVFRPVVSYMWYPGAIAGNPITVTPTTTTSYKVTGTDANGCVSDTASVQVAIRPIPGNPAVFGNNRWNVYAWNAGDASSTFGNSWNTNYNGYYTNNDLNINTELLWNALGAPSDAAGYQGCPVGVDNHSYSYKRKGFSCGYYQLDVPGHDDEAQLLINGVMVWNHDGCCDSHTNVWTGWLGVNDSVEYRVTEGGGLSYGYLSFNLVTPPALLPITGGPNVCVGSSKQLSNSSPGTGTWSSSDITKCTVNSTTGVITGVAVGTSVITFNSIAPNGCAAGSVTTSINVLASPTVATITGNRVPCLGTTTQLANTTLGGTWASLNPSIATVSSTGLVTTVSVGTATITYTTLPNASGCTRTATTTVSVRAIPSVAPITGNTGVCIGNTTQLSNATTGGTWSSSNTGVATVSTTGLVTSVAVGTTTITYTTAANSGGCVNKATLLFNVTPFPTLNSPVNLTICSGYAFNYTPAANVSGTTFTWTRAAVAGISNPAVTAAQSGNINEALINTTSSPVSVVYVFVLFVNGCSTTQNVTVIVNPPPAPVAPVTGVAAVCGNNTSQLSTSTTGGIWSSSNNSIATVSNTGLVSPLSAGTTTISYTLTNGFACNSSASVLFTVNPPPTIAPITGGNSVCLTNSKPLSCTTPGGTWSSSDVTKVTVNATTGVITGVAGGTAVITYTVAPVGVGCTISTSVTITVLTALPTVATILGTRVVCLGLTTTLTNATAGGTWSSSNPAIASINSSTGVVTGNAVGTCNINYTTAPNAAGCTRTATVSYAVRALPTVAPITGGNGVCVGGTTQLANATTGGTWSSSNIGVATVSSTGLVTGVVAGTVVITYTTPPNSNGCVNSTTYTMTVNPASGISGITAANNPVCSNKTTTLTAVGVTGVSPVVTWYSGPGGTGTNFGTGATLPNAVAGTYFAVVTNACGTASAEATITVTSKPISTSDTTASACNSFTWRGTTYTSSGAYNLILTNSVGCDSIRTLNLTIRKNTITGTITNPLCFNAATGSISVSATGGTAPYLYKNGATGTYSTNSNFTALRAGSYTIFAQDATGCASSQVFVITQPTAVSATSTKVDATCPGLSNGSITVNGAGGTAPYTYRFGSTGAFTSTNTFTGLKAGSYRVFVNDANGCTGYSIVVVVANALPTCPLSPVFAKAIQPAVENAAMRVTLSPNPTGNVFNLMVHAPKQESISVRIFDVNGKIVHTVKGMPEQTIRFGENFISGTYMVEVRQGDEVKTVKAMKVR